MTEYYEIEYLEDLSDDEQTHKLVHEFDSKNETFFDETQVDSATELHLTKLLELDDSYENDKTMATVYVCPICESPYLGKESIKAHVKKYFKFNCGTCGKRYFKERYLDRHKKNAHLPSKELTCPICNKKFRAKNNLKLHLYLHSDEWKFTCSFCEKKFKQKPGLQQHLRTYHLSEQRRECPYCHELVNRLNYHIKTEHTEENIRKLKQFSAGK